MIKNIHLFKGNVHPWRQPQVTWISWPQWNLKKYFRSLDGSIYFKALALQRNKICSSLWPDQICVYVCVCVLSSWEVKLLLTLCIAWLSYSLLWGRHILLMGCWWVTTTHWVYGTMDENTGTSEGFLACFHHCSNFIPWHMALYPLLISTISIYVVW